MLTKLILPMKQTTPFIWLALLLCSCAATAPADQDARKLPVETLWTDSQSSHASLQPQALYITSQSRLDGLARTTPNKAAAAFLKLHRVDWNNASVLWIFMGQKSSGGYALNLKAPEAVVTGGVAVISVRWREPAPGSIVTQQLTSPCLVLKLPKGPYTTIEIRDETGHTRIRLAL